MSGYMDALEGAATLSAYVDAEFLAVVELTKGMAKVSVHVVWHESLGCGMYAAAVWGQLTEGMGKGERLARDLVLV